MGIWRTTLSILVAAPLIASGASPGEANIFSNRPGSLSTSVRVADRGPALFTVTINGQQIAHRYFSSLDDLGGAPWEGPFDRSFDIRVVWIEIYSGRAFEAAAEVPHQSLSRYDPEGDHADLAIRLGEGGAMAVETSHPELLRLLGSGQQDAVTPEMDAPQRLVATCGQEIARTDPRYAELSSWIDAEAKALADRWTGSGATARPDPLAGLNCGEAR